MKKPKRPYKPSNENARLLKNCHDAIAEVHEAGGVADSPEGFCYAMKGLLVLQERIAARLGLSRHNVQAMASADTQSPPKKTTP